MRRLACGFQLSLRPRLESSKLFAKSSLAQVASYQGRFHADASIHILENESVAMRPNHEAKTAADAMQVIPAS
jgi:hypothetical protein